MHLVEVGSDKHLHMWMPAGAALEWSVVHSSHKPRWWSNLKAKQKEEEANAGEDASAKLGLPRLPALTPPTGLAKFDGAEARLLSHV